MERYAPTATCHNMHLRQQHYCEAVSCDNKQLPVTRTAVILQYHEHQADLDDCTSRD